MTHTFTLLAVSVTVNVTLLGIINTYKGELAYWRANATLRDPKTGRYVKKGR